MINNARGLGLVIIWSALVSTTSALAQDEAERQKLLAAVNEVINDEVKYEMAVSAGRDRILLCAQCHGVDGNSRTSDVPNLAGQNPTYLLEQIGKFVDGQRKDFVMQSLSRSFTFEDRVHISVYFASQQVKPQLADPVLAREGSRIFQSVCKICHGEDGRGETGYARIAGQQTDYVVTTLKRFRANARASVGAKDMKRHDVRMEQVTHNLTDRDIAGLAAYITLLK